MTWTPRDEAERAAVVALCVEAITKHANTSFHVNKYMVAERIVPPVPVPVEYRSIGVADAENLHTITYEEGQFVLHLSGGSHTFRYASLHRMVKTHDLCRWTDGVLAALLDLKANPTVTPPTRERVEPVAWSRVSGWSGQTVYHEDKADAERFAARDTKDGYNVADPVPLYRHPATPDDAIALLVRERWVDETRHMNRSRNLYMAAFKDHNDVPTRVLIAPTPERAS